MKVYSCFSGVNMNKENPIVSVIIPVFNGMNTLFYLLKDLKSQDFLDAEFILVNDGSTDASRDYIEKFINNSMDSRFILINQKNSGASSARNNGIRRAKGKYIMFADADDRLSRKFVSGYVKKIVKNQTDMEVFSLKKIDNLDNLNIIGKIDYSKLASQNMTYSNFWGYLADGIIRGYVVTYITKRELWNNVKFNEKITYCEDEFAYCQILINNPNIKIHFNGESYYYYFIHESSATNTLEPTSVYKSLKMADMLIHQAKLKKKITVSSRRLNQLEGNFYWKMIVVSILKKDNDSFDLAKRGYLKIYPKTTFRLKNRERRGEYIFLKLHLDFILKKIIYIKKMKK